MTFFLYCFSNQSILFFQSNWRVREKIWGKKKVNLPPKLAFILLLNKNQRAEHDFRQFGEAKIVRVAPEAFFFLQFFRREFTSFYTLISHFRRDLTSVFKFVILKKKKKGRKFWKIKSFPRRYNSTESGSF